MKLTDKSSSAKRAAVASYGQKAGTVFSIGGNGSAGIHESWVRPDGTIERNIKMDLVVSAAARRVSTP